MDRQSDKGAELRQWGCGNGPAERIGDCSIDSHSRAAAPILPSMLPPAYLAKRLTQPLPTKDGGVLRTIADVQAYMVALPEGREGAGAGCMPPN
jgi:hypothetical protein